MASARFEENRLAVSLSVAPGAAAADPAEAGGAEANMANADGMRGRRPSGLGGACCAWFFQQPVARGGPVAYSLI